MVRRSYPILFLIAANVLLAGCNPSLEVKALTPGEVNLGPATKLVLVQSEGGFSFDRREMVAELFSQVRRDGFFQLTDARNSGNLIRWAGPNRLAVTRSMPHRWDEVWLRIDVETMDAYDCEGDEWEEYDEETGESWTVQEDLLCGEVTLDVSAVGPNGEVFLFSMPYHGYSALPWHAHEDDAISAALHQAVASLLSDITPQWTSSWVRLDDEDARQEPILDRAQRGDLAGAIAELDELLSHEPQNASAHYNLAVMLDASMAYAEALVSYDRAIRLSDKGWYRSARKACEQRLADQRSLTGR